jgi:hypothetical protein
MRGDKGDIDMKIGDIAVEEYVVHVVMNRGIQTRIRRLERLKEVVVLAYTLTRWAGCQKQCLACSNK